MRLKLITLLVLHAAFAAAQSVGDFSIPYKSQAEGPMTPKYWPKANSTLWGTDASGNPQSITIGSGLTLTGSTLTSSGGGSGGSGTVTSVNATVPTFLSVTGVPITSSGTISISLSGTALPAANGGTGATSFTDGQLLIGNSTGNTLTKATLTAGSGITVTNGGGSISLSIGTGAVTNTMLSGSIALSKLATDPLARANHTGTQTLSTISDAGTLAALSTITSSQITDGTIVNADISSSAAIALSKLATDPLARANHTGTQTLSTISDAGSLAALSSVTSAYITDGTIVNADISSSAAIALSKLATDPLARANHTGTQAASTITGLPEEIIVPCSTETDGLTTGAPTVTFKMPCAMTLTAVYLDVLDAPTGSPIIVDVKEAGTSIFSTKPQIATGATTSEGGAVPGVISDTSLAARAVITINVDQIGSGVPGTGLKVTLKGTR
ncbi:hypothetical protein [Prosthecobacter sp.]|uniref:hypothetical protein n=1 Tax=Prosthecobacter sp. TaxID=1965333 RepID=UPI0037830DCB